MAFRTPQNAKNLEDSHSSFERRLRILEEFRVPKGPESLFPRGFSSSLRTDNENPRGFWRSGRPRIGFKHFRNGKFLEDSHCPFERGMRIPEEFCVPDTPEREIPRGFSFLVRTDNENPLGISRSEGSRKPFSSRIFVFAPDGE